MKSTLFHAPWLATFLFVVFPMLALASPIMEPRTINLTGVQNPTARNLGIPADVHNLTHALSNTFVSKGRIDQAPYAYLGPYTPVTGHILKGLRCFSKGDSDYGNYFEFFVRQAVDSFCIDMVESHDGSTTPISAGERGEYLRDKSGSKRLIIDVRVKNVEGCETGDGEDNKTWMSTPAIGLTCRDMLYATWSQCLNNNRGGAVDAGCLRFMVRLFVMGKDET